MRLSTIIRAIVRPYVAPLLYVNSWDGGIVVVLGPPTGAGFSVCHRPGILDSPTRRIVRKIGDLEIAWWGRDTLVHPVGAP